MRRKTGQLSSQPHINRALCWRSRTCLDGGNQAWGQKSLEGEGDPGAMQGLHLQPPQQGRCCCLYSAACLLHNTWQVSSVIMMMYI